MAKKEKSAFRKKSYTRFTLLQRIQHFTFLISFSLLGFTGLPQKYPTSPISLGIFNLMGGVEITRAIHHNSAIVMIIISSVHIVELLYSLIVVRTPITMIPWINDLQHVINDVQYYLGFRSHKGYYGRYSYAEKMEYLALIWGTVVMALTGIMMWNPISTLNFLPGESIPAAKAAHGGEAVLAVAAIIIWHFYHVHIKMLNKSMFTGELTRKEMKHEHPAELAVIESGVMPNPIPPVVKRKRQMVFAPLALVTFLTAGFVVYYLVGFEATAQLKPAAGETAKVFSPLPSPTPLPPTPTEPPSTAPIVLTWEGYVGPLFQQKCAACHGAAAMGGVNLTTLADTMKTITNNDSANSQLIIKQIAGGHPGQLSSDEITQIKAWIDKGSPEK